MTAPVPNDTAYRLLITGSRDASPAMLDYARRVVERAKVNGWEIVVGDASGVDSAVIEACCVLGVTYQVFGITPDPRNGPKGNYVRVDATSYLTRDEVMCRRADRCIAIWNGEHARHGGPSGTEYTYNYALKLGIPADIRPFKVVKR